MYHLEKFEFGDSALSYIQSCLTAEKTLSAHVREVFQNTKGKAFAYLPRGTSLELMRDFESGYIARRGHSFQKTAEVIDEFLSESSRNRAIFETPSSPTDPFLEKYFRGRYFTFGQEVYYFLDDSDRTPEKILSTLQPAGDWTSFIGILTSIPSGGLQHIVDRQEVEAEILKMLAENLQHIIVEAYDGEAFLIWSKSV